MSRPQTIDHRSQPVVVRDHRDTPPVVVRDHRGTPPVVVPPRAANVSWSHEAAHSVVVRDRADARSDFRAQVQGEFDNIFSRNDLSIEDKIMLLLFKVMGKMDEELTKKTKQVADARSETTQTGKPGAGADGAQTTNKDSAAAGKESLDSQTLELQQLVSRRNNLFATINAIVNKFDESAGKVINKLSQG